MLRSLLAKTWPMTLTAAMAGFLGTILIVHLIGAASFADYAIDLAKLSALMLLTELIPSSYSVFQQQKDPAFEDDIAAFILLLLLIVPVGVLALHKAGVFSSFSFFIVAYAAGAVVQRYLDVRFQARGRITEFYAIPLTANIIRLTALLGLGLLVNDIPPGDLAWGAAAAGIVSSQVIFFVRSPTELAPFLRRCRRRALSRLWAQRADYVRYYPNIVLKRTRDIAMALICDALAPSKVEVGKYLLAYRGIDFASGQLRVIEAFLSNIGIREALASSRTRSLLLLALVGQITAATMSFVLIAQAGVDSSTLALAIAGSFFVYPYVLELAIRSDAYAAFAPQRVTISLLTFLAAIGITVSVAWYFTDMRAIHLMAAPLLGQSLATLSYRVFK